MSIRLLPFCFPPSLAFLVPSAPSDGHPLFLQSTATFVQKPPRPHDSVSSSPHWRSLSLQTRLEYRCVQCVEMFFFNARSPSPRFSARLVDANISAIPTSLLTLRSTTSIPFKVFPIEYLDRTRACHEPTYLRTYVNTESTCSELWKGVHNPETCSASNRDDGHETNNVPESQETPIQVPPVHIHVSSNTGYVSPPPLQAADRSHLDLRLRRTCLGKILWLKPVNGARSRFRLVMRSYDLLNGLRDTLLS